jgi:hypothetical protein
VKASNFQRNGNVQAALEEQYIRVAKKIYHLRRSMAVAQRTVDLEAYNKFVDEFSSLWTEFNTLGLKASDEGLELSQRTLEILNHATNLVDLSSPPLEIMLD